MEAKPGQGEVLVIRTCVMLRPEDMERFRQSVIDQMTGGVVCLPPGTEALIVPEDIEIRFREPNRSGLIEDG